MIALTQEKREELILQCECVIRSLKKSLIEHPEERSLEGALLRQEIALTALTSEPVMVNKDFHDAALGIIDGRFHRCGRSVTLEKVGIYGQDKMHPVYLIPPVPEIKFGSDKDCEEGLKKHGLRTRPHGPSQLSDGFRCGFAWREHIIKRLNGLGE